MKRTASILLVLALLLSFAIPAANAAETTHIVFSGKEEDSYGFVVGPAARTYTFDIATDKAWRMFGSYTNSSSAGRTWKWKGKGQTALTLPLAANTEEDINFYTAILARNTKAKEALGDFTVAQLCAKDYTKLQSACRCGADRIIGVYWSGYSKKAGLDVRRIDISNAKQHALINNDGSLRCYHCEMSLDDLFIFVYGIPESADPTYGLEKHTFNSEKVCTGCGYKREIKASKITLTAPEKTIPLGGDGVKLTYTLKPAKSTSTVTFSSGKPKVATVDETGLVTPVSAGKVTITAKTSSGKTATVKLTVVDPKAPVSVRFDPKKPITLDIGQHAEVVVVMLPVTAESKLIWMTSKKDIASVTPVVGAEANKFSVTGLKKGVTWLTVKTENGKTSRIKVTVTKNIYTPPTA